MTVQADKPESSTPQFSQEALDKIKRLNKLIKKDRDRIAVLEGERDQIAQELKRVKQEVVAGLKNGVFGLILTALGEPNPYEVAAASSLALDKAQRELAEERQLCESLQSRVAELEKEVQGHRDRIASDGKQIERYPQELTKAKLDTKYEVFRELCGSIGPTALGALSDPHAITQPGAVVVDAADADRIARRTIGFLAKESVSLINRTGDHVVLLNETDLMRFKLLGTAYVPNLEMIVGIPGIAWQGRPLIKAQLQAPEKVEEKLEVNAEEKPAEKSAVSRENSESDS